MKIIKRLRELRKKYFPYKVTIIKVNHAIYKELKEAKKKGKTLPKLVGKYHRLYSSRLGEISMVRFLNYGWKGNNFWEIHAYKNKRLFEDCERYKTKREAEERIWELLK